MNDFFRMFDDEYRFLRDDLSAVGSNYKLSVNERLQMMTDIRNDLADLLKTAELGKDASYGSGGDLKLVYHGWDYRTRIVKRTHDELKKFLATKGL